MPQNNLDKIEHIVVLMLENRSFDNVLGWLYDPENEPPFNREPRGEFRGVNNKMSNPGPNQSVAYVQRGTDPTAPFPDPNEPYEFVYRQMFSKNLDNSVEQPPPHIRVPNMTEPPTMDGFVIDYKNAIEKANAKRKKKCWLFRKPPFEVDPAVIMNCFPPSYLPAINGLAQNFAVCDNWFSSVPTQTFPNRSFVHAATSSGNVYNIWKTGTGKLDFGAFINKTETIYDLLESEGVSWKIYHGGPLFLCNALLIQENLWDYAFSEHFSPYKTGDRHKTFQQDLDDQTLPAYSFIEPNLICSDKYGPENDMHPAYAILEHGPPTDVRYGDELIYEIYSALRNSDYYWEKTLFVIIFDEHGGCFDHVPPAPAAVSPDDIVIPYTDGWNGGSGFDFKRFGVRVPAVLVSPWIEEGTICHTQFDHTSVIKSVANKWLSGRSLTKRDAAAEDVSEVLNRPTPRQDKFEIPLNKPPVFKGCGSKEISSLQSDLIQAAVLGLLQKHKKDINLKALNTREKIVSKFDDVAEGLLKKK